MNPQSSSPSQGSVSNLQRPQNPSQLVPQQFGTHQSSMDRPRPQMVTSEQQQFEGSAELALLKAKYRGHLNEKDAARVQQVQQAVSQQRPVNLSRPQSAQQMLPVAQPQTQKPINQGPTQQMSVQPAGTPPTTQPLQQAKAPLASGHQIPPIDPNLVLNPGQVTIMDTKDVPRQILGQLSNQIPLQLKTWGQVKGYLSQSSVPPQYLEVLRSRQAQHFQLLARAQMLRRIGFVPPQQQQQPQSQPQPPSQPPSQQQQQPQQQQQQQQKPQSQHQHQPQQHQVPVPQPSQAATVPNQRPQAATGNLSNTIYFQQLQALSQQGKLTPQQNMQFQQQQQIFNHRQQQERQRAAAAIAAQQRAQLQPNPAPQVPAQQLPKQSVVARPQQPSSDPLPAPKKLKRERDSSEEVVTLDQRPASQMGIQQPFINHPMSQPQQPQFVNQAPPGQKPPPPQAPIQQQVHVVKQQPGQHTETIQPAQQTQGGADQKLLLASLSKMLEDEKNSHQSRPPLNLEQHKKGILHQQLSDGGTKNMIRRTDQLLPMFVLLGGTDKATRELIRMVFSQPSLCLLIY